MDVALDLDGTLADLHGALMAYEGYDNGAFEQWDKPDYEQFMVDATRVWDDRACVIEPVNKYVGPITESLYRSVDSVDIVTNTAGSIDSIEEWLIDNQIVHDRIIHAERSGRSKQDYGYDVYIDDKPAMAGTVPVLYMPNRKWNDRVCGDGEYIYHSLEPAYRDLERIPTRQFRTDAPWVIRYDDLHDVVENIRYAIQ